MQKRIAWSYPTSPNAKRLGFYNAGCWTVATSEGDAPAKAVMAFPTYEQAMSYASAMHMPWSRWTR